ncbi:hypothetical protein L6452_23103 [Arctium lappa]|uniref:Uncharacterized protein n=1 Tax=Arctium lappa TaxID=4217 RepID=A0ACB9B5T6_ARCLA|nr:hypothetical protein L6452_23103 [Arctium lappa]
MAGLELFDEHNEVAMLQKPKQAEGFHQIVDFLKSSHIAYALTVNPTIYVEHLRQFWANASIQTVEGRHIIQSRVCDKPITISEDNIRIHLHLDDASGITSLPKEDLFQVLSRMGYEELPKGKVFSNMKRSSKDFSGKDTPLFSTMMGVSLSHGEASGSQPTSDHPTDDLPTPFNSINIPQIPIVKPTSPITKIYIRKKVQKVPSLRVPSPPKPSSPLMEHSPLENIERETIGVSPNPQKVLYKEKDEHVGSKAHTTVFAQGVGQDSVNIPKTFPTATLDEKSSKGPRSKDPSRVVNTPKGGEDIYNYEELMETIANVNLDVLKQGAKIKEMQKVIISQQGQIAKLKKMVLKLVHKKKRTQFVLKKRSIPHDASKKGESQAEVEKQRPVRMESHFEGEIGAEEQTAKEVETTSAAVTTPEVVTTAVETDKVAAETGMSAEEIAIAETLVKAKNDTPKATQKAKGVVIKEGGSEQIKKKISQEEIKKKGKEKVVESEKPMKKLKQIDLDEELAKKLQEEMEKEEEIQSAKDRKIALELSTKLNEEFQRSLKTAVAAKKVTQKASRQRLTLKTRQRQPSKTFLANQERRKMINFLKGSVGVKEGMLTNMSYGRIEELYKKEMAKLQGDFTQRVEVERKMKERHDLNIQQPFPDSEEGTPIKDKEEVKKEETLAHKIGAIKRKKSIATKKQAKRPRIEEVEKENKSERAEVEAEPTVAPSAEPEQNQEQSNQQFNEQFHLYMTLTDEEPVQAGPISMKAPEIIFWDILKDNRKEYFRFKEWVISLRFMQLGAKIKDLHFEYGFKKIDHWMMFENCGVYMITIDKSYHEYYLVDKIYDHNKAKLEGMLKAKLHVYTAEDDNTAEDVNAAG